MSLTPATLLECIIALRQYLTTVDTAQYALRHPMPTNLTRRLSTQLAGQFDAIGQGTLELLEELERLPEYQHLRREHIEDILRQNQT